MGKESRTAKDRYFKYQRTKMGCKNLALVEDSVVGFVRALYGEVPFTKDSPVCIKLD